MYISDRPGLPLRILLSRSTAKDLPYPFTAENAMYFLNGRACIYHSIDIMNLTPGDSVLLPAYLDEAVVKPFLEKGVSIIFYEVNYDLTANIEDILSKITRRTKAVFVINYFGFPQPLEHLKKICKEHGLYLIEDNAQGLLSRDGNRFLGTFGDISIFSIRKTIPTPDGGILVLNNKSMLRKPRLKESLRSPSRVPLYFTVLDLVLRDSQSKYNFSFMPIHVFTGKISSMLHENYINVSISGISLKIIKNTDFNEVYIKRRHNFEFILDKIHSVKNVRPIFDHLPRGVCPWGFPILIKSRNKVHRYFRKRGIILPIHWILPSIIPLDKFPISRFLQEHIITLPVHQGLSLDKLALILETLKSVLS